MSEQPSDFDLDGLREGFGGTVLTPAEQGYGEALPLFNAMVEKHPAAIAQCETADDVRVALGFARENGLDVAVRGGGHSAAGTALADDGLVIDLRRMKRVDVDPEARTARVGGGATWGDFDRACQPYGLATTGGRVSTTGVAGLTLGGGSGWLERKFGMACDNLVSVTLVTADGDSVTASEDENPELFWALHGGGGNFGVATELTFRLHTLPVGTLAMLIFSPEAAPQVIARYRDLIESGAPDELGGGVVFLGAGPPKDFVPEHLRGELTLVLPTIYAGPEAEAREAIRPLLELPPEGEMIAELPYAEIQCALDDPPGLRNYVSVEHLSGFPDEAIEKYCARAPDMVVPSNSQQVLFPQGGAVARGADDWPLPHRRARWALHPFGHWEDAGDDERGIAWVKTICSDLKPWSTGDAYLNFVGGEESRDRVISGFGEVNYERLAALKARYDPENVFRLNHNIEPAPA